MFLSFVIEIIIAYMFINRIESVKSNPVLINECLKSVEENWGRSDSYVNKYDYSIVDNYGKLIYKNADDIAISINDGIKKNDIMLDVSVDGKTVGKIIFDNKTIKKNRLLQKNVDVGNTMYFHDAAFFDSYSLHINKKKYHKTI